MNSAVRDESLAAWDLGDISWGMWKVAVWSILEVTLSIINCCLPLGPCSRKVISSTMWTNHIEKKGSTPQVEHPYRKGLCHNRGTNDIETGPFICLAD